MIDEHYVLLRLRNSGNTYGIISNNSKKKTLTLKNLKEDGDIFELDYEFVLGCIIEGILIPIQKDNK